MSIEDELRKLRGSIDRLTMAVMAVAESKAPPTLSDPDVMAQPVDVLELSVRASNILLAADIKTIGDLVAKTDLDLLKRPHCGRRVLGEIQVKLAGLGLVLRKRGR